MAKIRDAARRIEHEDKRGLAKKAKSRGSSSSEGCIIREVGVGRIGIVVGKEHSTERHARGEKIRARAGYKL